jgi:hypothetical protein
VTSLKRKRWARTVARRPKNDSGEELEPISKSPEEDDKASELEVSRPGTFTASLSQNRA